MDVVVCSYAGDDLELALQSIAAASGQAGDGRVVVVDSWPDATLEERLRDVERAEHVRVAPGTALGGARQTGTDRSGARYVAYLDSDAIPRAGWFAALRDAVAVDGVGVAGGPVLPRWPAARVPPLFRAQPAYDFLSMLDLGASALDMPRVLPGNMAVDRKEVGERVFSAERGRTAGDLVGAEETAMMTEYVRSGGRIVYAPGAVVDHATRAERLTWRWMWRRVEAAGREAGMLGESLEPLPRRFGARDYAFLAAVAPAYYAGRIRHRLGRAQRPDATD
jgi:glycosyltransferase involved in cell wall biosynthesis